MFVGGVIAELMEVLYVPLIYITPFMISLILIFVVTFIVSKTLKKGRLILKGVFIGGVLSIIVLTYLWFTMLLHKPDAYVGSSLIMFLFGQPLTWIAGIFVRKQTVEGANASMVSFSLTFLLNCCGIGAFAGWLIQRKRKNGKRVDLKAVGKIPHHNI